MSLIPSRRRFLFAAASFLAAPAIVRAASLMPVSAAPHNNLIVAGMTAHGFLIGDVITFHDDGPPWRVSGRRRWIITASSTEEVEFTLDT